MAPGTASTSSVDTLTIRRPDDWHLHVRDGAGLRSVVPHSAAHFGRAIIMPNTQPPVTTVQQVCTCTVSIRAGRCRIGCCRSLLPEHRVRGGERSGGAAINHDPRMPFPGTLLGMSWSTPHIAQSDWDLL